ncbi:MAG: hypothetical protein ACK5PP_17295 [Acidimicrobiales bacterium]
MHRRPRRPGPLIGALAAVVAMTTAGCSGLGGDDTAATSAPATTTAGTDPATSASPVDGGADDDDGGTPSITPSTVRDTPPSIDRAVPVEQVTWWADGLDSDVLLGLRETEEAGTAGCEGEPPARLDAFGGDGEVVTEGVQPAGQADRVSRYGNRAAFSGLCEGFVIDPSVGTIDDEGGVTDMVPLDPVDGMTVLSLPVWSANGAELLVSAYSEDNDRLHELTYDPGTGALLASAPAEASTLAEFGTGARVLLWADNSVTVDDRPIDGAMTASGSPLVSVSADGSLVALGIDRQIVVVDAEGTTVFTATAPGGRFIGGLGFLDSRWIVWVDGTDQLHTGDLATGDEDTLDPDLGSGYSWSNLAVANGGYTVGLSGYDGEAWQAAVVHLD